MQLGSSAAASPAGSRFLRQASRRSWRIGQRQAVRVKFLCYAGTMQAKCLRLMGKKLLVALALEGKFSGEGLQALDESEDMLTAMARELVEKNGIGESADAVWRQLNMEHQRLFVHPMAADSLPAREEVPGAEALPEWAIPEMGEISAPRRRAELHLEIPEQGWLF
jgi:hypothetical protein